ncbi:MAG: OpgC domain-containing protein [Gammaproteobacteria bacterium]|nr:OpgC domain-containing protein [Gammaproteobacteria bacterium]
MKRRYELDALRGIFLLVMAGTHLPTAVNSAANQPLGYVSAAEGFVFLSAFLVGSIYTPLMFQRGAAYVRGRLWKRARKLYGYHLLLLFFVFTVVAGIAVWTGSQALYNYAAIFFQRPAWAVAASPVLLYQPPLLDILPMYIAFLLLSPPLLQLGSRRGWWPILVGSGLLWLLAQLSGERLLYAGVAAAGLPLRHEALGAFNWLGWQLVWVGGLWLGFRQHRRDERAPAQPWLGKPAVMLAACGLVIFFLLWRYHVGGLFAGIDAGSPLLDKWKLGPLRVVNCISLGLILNWALLPALCWLRIGVLELLGRNSLQVFSAHIPVCVLGGGLVGYQAAPSTPLVQTLLWMLMLGVMLFVAWRSDASNRGSASPSAGHRAPSTVRGPFRADRGTGGAKPAGGLALRPIRSG